MSDTTYRGPSLPVPWIRSERGQVTKAFQETFKRLASPRSPQHFSKTFKMKAEKIPTFPTTIAERHLRRHKSGRPITVFQYKVYDLCSQIPKGYYSTYKEISDHLKSSPRAVGQALRNNPFAPTVPCHRVLASNHFIGGFFGQWGKGSNINKKQILLKEEGLDFDESGSLSVTLRKLRLFREFK
ncbi:hypothetical protein SpCBS45565_g00861 [Spizellomyces sp. 'palustris']|nr:hypothetical protein SpCBS45565_g00861 [Spizellomyces sp. 'palustris']